MKVDIFGNAAIRTTQKRYKDLLKGFTPCSLCTLPNKSVGKLDGYLWSPVVERHNVWFAGRLPMMEQRDWSLRRMEPLVCCPCPPLVTQTDKNSPNLRVKTFFSMQIYKEQNILCDMSKSNAHFCSWHVFWSK